MSNTNTSNGPVAFGVIMITGGSNATFETESHQILVTPVLPEFSLPARMFQRRDKNGESWVESGISEDQKQSAVETGIEMDEKGEILKFTEEAQRMLQARYLSATEDGSGAYLVPLSSEDIDALANVKYPDLPESVINKALEVLL